MCMYMCSFALHFKLKKRQLILATITNQQVTELSYTELHTFNSLISYFSIGKKMLLLQRLENSLRKYA